MTTASTFTLTLILALALFGCGKSGAISTPRDTIVTRMQADGVTVATHDTTSDGEAVRVLVGDTGIHAVARIFGDAGNPRAVMARADVDRETMATFSPALRFVWAVAVAVDTSNRTGLQLLTARNDYAQSFSDSITVNDRVLRLSGTLIDDKHTTVTVLIGVER
jgi:hypothetical protein